MNERNHLEKQLLAWMPRRPSARLRARLFDRKARRSPWQAPFWPWFAPATGTLLLLFVTLSQRSVELERMAHSGSQSLVALNLSNQTLAAFLVGDSQSRQNGIPIDRIEWTSDGRFPSSTASFPQLGTNGLKR